MPSLTISVIFAPGVHSKLLQLHRGSCGIGCRAAPICIRFSLDRTRMKRKKSMYSTDLGYMVDVSNLQLFAKMKDSVIDEGWIV